MHSRRRWRDDHSGGILHAAARGWCLPRVRRSSRISARWVQINAPSLKPRRHAYCLADLLRAEGVALTLGHSKYIKAISYAKVKTDAVDAATLAQLMRSDLIPEAHMISPELREPRDPD